MIECTVGDKAVWANMDAGRLPPQNRPSPDQTLSSRLMRAPDGALKVSLGGS
jgi:hypothetical protein